MVATEVKTIHEGSHDNYFTTYIKNYPMITRVVL